MSARSLRVIVEADGGARGNPGPAGYGAVVREADTGQVLMERAEALGIATNNVAEYSGLIAGLGAAAELGATEVDVRMDSKLVVEQMSGRWQIKHPGLRPLAAEAASLIRRFESVSFHWIPRERNKHADRLANEAMDVAAGKRPRNGERSATTATTARSAPPTPAVEQMAIEQVGGGRQPAVGQAAPGQHLAEPPVAAPVGGARYSPRYPEHQGPTADGPRRTSTERADGGSPDSAQPESGGPRSWMPPLAPPTRLLIVRHGETVLTSQHRFSGRGDVALSDHGLAQVRAAAQRVVAIAGQPPVSQLTKANPLAAVVSSPLSRCRQTAELIAEAAGGLPVAVDEDLVECDFGLWEGLTFAEVGERWPDELSAWLADPAVAPPDGESFRQVAERVARAVARLRERRPGDTIAVVSHVSPIKLLLRDALAADDSLLHRLYLDAAGISVVDFWPDGGVAVRSVNETAHLPVSPQGG